MEDVNVSEIGELKAKPAVYKDEPESHDVTSSSSDSSDAEDWRSQLHLTKNRVLRVVSQTAEDDHSEKITLSLEEADGDSKPCGSNSSSNDDVFEDCMSHLSCDGSDVLTVVDTDEAGDKDADNLELEQFCLSEMQIPVRNTVLQSNSENIYPREHDSNNCWMDGRTKKSDKIKFCKDIPLDPTRTWDFSLQALDKDFKSKVLWIEGNVYQKFVGECLHEMHNVPCECDEKRKIAMCRICHVVFCSNQCFKRVIKRQTGDEDEDTEEPAGLSLSLQEGTPTPVLTSTAKSSESKAIHTVEIAKPKLENRSLLNETRKYGIDYQDQPEKLAKTEKHKQQQFPEKSVGQSSRDTTHQPKQSDSRKRQFTKPQWPQSPQFWPTQVHINAQQNPTGGNKVLSSMTPPLKSSKSQDGQRNRNVSGHNILCPSAVSNRSTISLPDCEHPTVGLNQHNVPAKDSLTK